jgi:hypothetical protein
MPTLIFIHGRGLKPPKAVERQNWLAALNRGLTRLSPPTRQIPDDEDHFRLAYWSDLFYPPESVNNSAQVTSVGGIVSAAEAGLSDVQGLSVESLVESFWKWRLPQPATAPQSPDPQTKQFEDGYVRDTIKFFGLGYGDTCAKALTDQLAEVEAGDPVMIVSHSFGTVIAYEVLLRDLPQINGTRQQPLMIDTWVTMGAPLGWAIDLQGELPTWAERGATQLDQDARAVVQSISQVVQTGIGVLRQSSPAASPPDTPVDVVQLPPKQFPDTVARWFNIYDVRDPVACGGGLGTVVGDLALSETFLYQNQERAFDVTIRNDDCPPTVRGVDIRAHDDFDGYGQCAQLAQLVSDFWVRFNGAWA